MPNRPVITVYADLWCPFAYVGLKRAMATNEVMDGSVQLALRSWPLELINGAPLPQEKTHANATALRASVAPDLFAGIHDWVYPTSTLPALALAAKANVADLQRGTAVSMHLRHLLFEEGLDLSSDLVLNEVAETFAIAREPEDLHLVNLEYHEGQRRGVKGSPHFFCSSGEEIFCPTLDLSRDEEGNLRVQQMVSRLEGFFARCAVA
jgi:predicted DsbA family dithiol-disulfide isomerase